MPIRFDYNESTLNKNLGAMSVKLGAAILLYSTTKANQIKADMKVNRPWTDRTGMAKTMLDAVVSQPSTDKIRITLTHGVDYGLWLELANEKNYAIIAPTVRQEGPNMVADLQNLMSKIKL